MQKVDLIHELRKVSVHSLHPEARPGETFICYEERTKTSDMELPGKRFGRRAFLPNGTEVTAEAQTFDIVPVFANREQNNKRYA